MLKQELLEVLNNYISNKILDYKENKLAKIIRTDLPKTLDGLLNNEKIKVKGSSGQGQWAEVPWIAFLHTEITDSTQSGYYVAYLFKANMDGVYISLNQGWQDYENTYGIKEAKTQITKVTKLYQDRLKEYLGERYIKKSSFSFSTIDLNNINKKTSLPEGYELGHIYGKYYSKEDIQSLNQNELSYDLNELINIYIQCVDNKLLNKDVNSDIKLIEDNNNLTPTQKKYLIDSRLGQGKFRSELLKLYPACPITKIKLKALLKASHIKPWRDSDNNERLDKFNGFMLAAHIDALFDNGYISFEDDGRLLISDLCRNDIDKLIIDTNIKIKIYDESKKYLEWHRDHIYKK